MFIGTTEQPGRFFAAPQTGRRIMAGFSYLQRIRKGATTEVWFPQELDLDQPEAVEWAAVRQFELLHETDNMYIYDMDVNDLRYSLENISKMRAGGYRLVVITLGCYTARFDQDDLRILDEKLQEEITHMIHFLYSSELSEIANAPHTLSLEQGTWSLEENLDHVALALRTKHLFKPEKETLRERVFFYLLKNLPANHVLHENAVGLQVPDATKEKNWVYVAKGENQLWQFQQTITTVFENLDKNRATMTHMRGYGDHLKEGFADWQKECLQSLSA